MGDVSRGSTSPTGWIALGCHPDRPVMHLSLGNPHSVVGVDDVAVVDLLDLGGKVPQVNLEIVEPGPDSDAITMRVHERGAGITEACGTGACAAAFAAARVGARRRPRTAKSSVHMDGGRAIVGFDRPSRAGHRVAHRTGVRSSADRPDRPRRPSVTDRADARRTTKRFGDTLIDRTIRERIVLVAVAGPRDDRRRRRRQPRRARAARRHRRRRRGRPDGAAPRLARPHVVHRQGQGRGAASSSASPSTPTPSCSTTSSAPAQQFNLEKLLGRTAIDRTAVILDIFGQNAHTLEGKAQVELALLRYRLPRLRRGRGANLSQQRGGVGARFGGGETKLEIDRRRIMRRITKLEADLEQLGRDPRRCSARAGARAGSPPSPSSATPTPASRRCSTGSPTPVCSSRTACSRRSIRRRGGSRCPAASRCC